MMSKGGRVADLAAGDKAILLQVVEDALEVAASYGEHLDEDVLEGRTSNTPATLDHAADNYDHQQALQRIKTWIEGGCKK